MKNIIRILIGVVIFSLVFVSCKKDKDDDTPAPTPTNSFTVNGVKYNLATGVLENYGQDDDIGDGWDYDGYNLDLTLFSSGITITASGDTLYEASGSGQVLYFEMFTSNGGYLDDGDYNFSAAQPFPVKSFDYGDYSVNVDIDNQTGDLFEFVSGKVTIARSESTYTINISCTDQNGQVVSGYYKGTLKYFDYTNQKRSTKKNF